MVEEWRAVTGYEGFYEVSDHGLVRSLRRIIVRSDGRLSTIQQRILKLALDISALPLYIRICKQLRPEEDHMHDLSRYTTSELLARYEVLERGPLSFWIAVGYRCACDEYCPWDSLAAVEAELVRKEMQVTR